MNTSLRELALNANPLVMVGAINAISALLAQHAGHKALYLSGAGVANADFGLPDLGLTNLDDVVEATRKITECVDLPLLVDGDTGWGSLLNIQRMVQKLILAGAAGVHIEDQEFPKRCGHRSGKILVTAETMVDRVKAAVDARTDENFVIMARTDAASVEGVDAAIARSLDYVNAGADMIFAEAIKNIDDYKRFALALGTTPVLANITEFGITPLFTAEQLAQAGIKVMLCPLSAMRAMNHAALKVYQEILLHGTQQSCLKQMQTREQLYDLLDYYTYEKIIDENRGDHV